MKLIPSSSKKSIIDQNLKRFNVETEIDQGSKNTICLLY